jgi:phosphate transport system substrate-binding protein
LEVFVIRKSLVLAVALAATTSAAQAASRDYISIVGSSTVYPFTTVVAESFGKSSAFKTPKIESTGTGGGMKLFCGGVGVEHADITNASRRIKQSEIDTCAKNGVTDIIEVKVGYDGIVLANAKSAPEMGMTRKEVYLALAKEVPDPAGGEKLVANPYKTWKEINGTLPATKIEVLGPPPTSGTRDAFVELVMEEGCKAVEWIKALEKSDKDAFKSACHTVREDGAFIEAGENDNLIVQKLGTSPTALGIFGFSFLEENTDKVKGAKVEGVAPTFEAIADGTYSVSRPLYVYVKKAHIGSVPGIAEFMAEFTSEKAWGDEGYLADKGLIPMPKEERAKFAKDVAEQNPLKGL